MEDCPICLSTSVDPARLSPCGHVGCARCLLEVRLKAIRSQDLLFKCPLCRTPVDACGAAGGDQTPSDTLVALQSSSESLREQIVSFAQERTTTSGKCVFDTDTGDRIEVDLSEEAARKAIKMASDLFAASKEGNPDVLPFLWSVIGDPTEPNPWLTEEEKTQPAFTTDAKYLDLISSEDAEGIRVMLSGALSNTREMEREAAIQTGTACVTLLKEIREMTG